MTFACAEWLLNLCVEAGKMNSFVASIQVKKRQALYNFFELLKSQLTHWVFLASTSLHFKTSRLLWSSLWHPRLPTWGWRGDSNRSQLSRQRAWERYLCIFSAFQDSHPEFCSHRPIFYFKLLSYFISSSPLSILLLLSLPSSIDTEDNLYRRWSITDVCLELTLG